MHTKNIALLAIASLAADAVAVNVHRHGHGQIHQKKDIQVETDFQVVTEWVTVTYDPNAPAPTVAAAVSTNVLHVAGVHSEEFSQVASSVAVAAPETSTVVAAAPATTSVAPVVIPTTLATQVKATEVVKAASVDSPAAAPATTEAAAPVAPTTAEAAEPATTTAAASTASAAPASTSGKKRGLAYNDPSLLSGFVGDNSKVSWAYSWSQVNDLTDDLEFIPMLWGPGDNHVNTWQANAKTAIAAGSSALLSFNEPDNAGQSNLDPATAASAHIQYMNPFQGQARISTPSITNSGTAGQGIDWLKQFVSACAGNCALDFVAVHWYSNNGDDFLSHLEAVYEEFNLPVWVTEFAPVGNEVDYNDFLSNAVNELDNNSKYSFVERYSYFMVADDSLCTGGQPNTLGNTFAYAS